MIFSGKTGGVFEAICRYFAVACKTCLTRFGNKILREDCWTIFESLNLLRQVLNVTSNITRKFNQKRAWQLYAFGLVCMGLSVGGVGRISESAIAAGQKEIRRLYILSEPPQYAETGRFQ